MKIKNRKLGGFISFKTGIDKKILSFLLCTFYIYIYIYILMRVLIVYLLKIFNKRLLLSLRKKKIIVG